MTNAMTDDMRRAISRIALAIPVDLALAYADASKTLTLAADTIQALREEVLTLRAHARVLVHAYDTDNSPPASVLAAVRAGSTADLEVVWTEGKAVICGVTVVLDRPDAKGIWYAKCSYDGDAVGSAWISMRTGDERIAQRIAVAVALAMGGES